MADLSSLNIPALRDMSKDEAIEHLRQIRLSRRTVKAKPKSVTKKAKAKKLPPLSQNQAANLLKILGDS